MAENWFANVQKYAANADETVVGAIVKYLGIALRKRDSSLVSFSDAKEVERVKERFLRKKLALTDPDKRLDEALTWVKGVMSDDRTKNRVTVYYLLAHYFGKLDLFGGPAGTTAASLGGTSAGLGAAAMAGVGGSTGIKSPGLARPAFATNLNHEDSRTEWPRWLTWMLIALAVIALFLILRSSMAEKQTSIHETSTGEATAAADADLAGGATATDQSATNTVVAVVPVGAGVVSGTRDSKPMLTIYFASGQSGVSNDVAAAAGTLKAFLDAHPGTKLAVSGFNDPSGNAALNAELSKKRAQAAAAALTAAGIALSSVELVKPADTTSASVTPDQARRVEVIIK